MSFFVTSASPGKGGDLGGLAGADAHCARSPKPPASPARPGAPISSTGATRRTPATASAAGPGTTPRARSIADDVAALHGDANGLTKATALNEKGEVVNGRGDTPNTHDILTGSQPGRHRLAGQTDLRRLDAERRRRRRDASATTTAPASTIRRRRSPGTPRMPSRGGCSPRRSQAPAAPACSTASRPTDPRTGRAGGIARRRRHTPCGIFLLPPPERRLTQNQ